MQPTRRGIWFWALLLNLCFTGALHAQDRSGKPGPRTTEAPDVEPPPATEETVRAARDVELRVEERVVETVGEGAPLAVEQTNGDWLWVRSDAGNHGWVKREDVTAADQAPQSGDEAKLTALGALTALHARALYGYIGTTADGHVHQVYNAETTRTMMTVVVNQITYLIPVIRNLQQGDFSEADKQYFERLIEIYQLLRQEAQSLIALTEARSQANIQAFDTARTSAWEKMEAAFGQ
jgi:hypothetical protein